MGAVILPLLGIYLILLIWATRYGYRLAQKKGWTGKKRWLGAAVGFLIVYLPVFWDWIPTIATHKYYCAKESGFWVYKSLDQWKQENPGVLEKLVANKVSIQTVGDEDNYTDTQILNQRFNWVTEKHKISTYMPIFRWKSEILDKDNNEVIARYVDFSSGNGRDNLMFWLNYESCQDGTNNRNNLYHFTDGLIKMTNTTKRSTK